MSLVPLPGRPATSGATTAAPHAERCTPLECSGQACTAIELPQPAAALVLRLAQRISARPAAVPPFAAVLAIRLPVYHVS